VPDRFNHRFCLLQYVMVPEAQDSPTLPFEIARSRRIRLFTVLRTIEFHDQLLRNAAEIRDVRRDRMLAAELQTTQLPAAQALPELLFRVAHVTAQAARVLERGCWQRWFYRRHFAVPSPLPSPEGRGRQRQQPALQHAALHLVALDAFKQGLEVAFAEAFVALALDDLEEDRAEGVLGEDLQQLALVGLRVGVDQDLVLRQPRHVLAVVRHA